MMFTVSGMALGGWMAGALYDLTGDYTASIIAAVGFNVLNLGIAALLIARDGGSRRGERSCGRREPASASTPSRSPMDSRFRGSSPTVPSESPTRDRRPLTDAPGMPESALRPGMIHWDIGERDG